MNNNIKEDGYWTVKEIRPYIMRHLAKEFPESIIKREFDKVDIMVLGPNIPVEIQKTYFVNGNPQISGFENDIRKQIEQDIEIFGQCRFYFDKKFLDYLNNGISSWSSINMDWFYQFWKGGKLKAFALSLNDIPKELDDKDFGFIRKFSSTCKISKDEEHRILERNKSKIAYNVFKGYGFNTEEINNWYDEYENQDKEDRFLKWLSARGGRVKKFGDVLYAIAHLREVNDMIKCNLKEGKKALHCSRILGIIDGNDDKYSRIACPDRYKILEQFPTYFEKKDLWDFWKVHMVSHRIFMAVVRGEYPNYLRDYKNQKSIEDAWG